MHVNAFDIRTVVLAKHAQHVVLIHFPLALFVAAVAFDYVAQWTKHQGLAGKVAELRDKSRREPRLTLLIFNCERLEAENAETAANASCSAR